MTRITIQDAMAPLTTQESEVETEKQLVRSTHGLMLQPGPAIQEMAEQNVISIYFLWYQPFQYTPD